MDASDYGSSLLENLTLKLASMPSLENIQDDFPMMDIVSRLKVNKAFILYSQRRITEARKELGPIIPRTVDFIDDQTSIHALVLLLECNMQQMEQLDGECEKLIGLLEVTLEQLELEGTDCLDKISILPYTSERGSVRGLGSFYSTRLMLLRREESKAAAALAHWISVLNLDESVEFTKQDLSANLSFITTALANTEIYLPLEVRLCAAELFLLLGEKDSAQSVLVDLLTRGSGGGQEAILVNNLAVVQLERSNSSSMALEGLIRSRLDSYSLACALLMKDRDMEASGLLNDLEMRKEGGRPLLLVRMAEALIGLHQDQAKKEDPDCILLLFRALECLQQFLQQQDDTLHLDFPPPVKSGFDQEKVRQHALALISYVHLMLGDAPASLAAAEQGMGERAADPSTATILATYAASSLDSLGRTFEALDILKDARGRSNSMDICLSLAALTAREQGDGIESLRCLKEIDGGSLFSSYLLMAMGKPDEAMGELRKLQGPVNPLSTR